MTPEELEERTFRNSVFNEKESLTRILNGELASNIYTKNKRVQLIKHGLLKLINGPIRGRVTALTPRAKAILGVETLVYTPEEEKRIKEILRNTGHLEDGG